MSRTLFDCGRVPGQTCSVQISGERAEVLAAAKHHLESFHKRADEGDLDQKIAKAVDEPAAEPTPYNTWV